MDVMLTHVMHSTMDENSAFFHKFGDISTINIVVDFCTAGLETVAVSLRWLFLYMLHFPEIQRQVHQELDEVRLLQPDVYTHASDLQGAEVNIQRVGRENFDVVHLPLNFRNYLYDEMIHNAIKDMDLNSYFCHWQQLLTEATRERRLGRCKASLTWMKHRWSTVPIISDKKVWTMDKSKDCKE